MSDVTTAAMLVSLTIKQWSCSKKDREITTDVLTSHKALADSGSFTKKLLAKEQIKSLRQITSAARAKHYEMTLPWSQDGSRILPAALFPDYDTAMREAKTDFQQAVASFIAAYPGYIIEARNRLGSLFKPDDYPSVEQMAEMFSWDHAVSPIPRGDDFRVNLSGEVALTVRKEIEQRTRQQIEASVGDLWQRTYKAVQHMAESLEDYVVVENGERKVNPFHHTLVGNVQQIASLLPALNITNDPALDHMAKQIEAKLTNRTAKELRKNEVVRQEQAKDARSILAAMKDTMH